MDSEWIVRIILFGVVHWILAAFMLHDLASRDRVFGKRKPPWALAVLFIPCFGSLLYMLFHPQIFYPPHPNQHHRKNKR